MPRAKYNRSVSENRAISQRIDELRMQGLPNNRATAAAFRMFADGEMTIKVQQQPVTPAKSKQEIAMIKATIAAANELRKQKEAEKRKQDRREMLLRQATIAAKKEGRQVTREERIQIERLTR